ncbi:MAG: hypothetical protein GY851_28310 [bacterium]|nr:hypothetical protein [bacterium]
MQDTIRIPATQDFRIDGGVLTAFPKAPTGGEDAASTVGNLGTVDFFTCSDLSTILQA